MIALIASIFALGVGPLIYQTFGPLKRTDKIVSGFILIVIAATIFFEVLPDAYEVIGYLSVGLALLGFLGPSFIETLFAKTATKTHQITILLGIIGLILHASIDGAALHGVDMSNQHDNLSLAIILHRLPVGLTIWWLLKPLIGERYALLTILAMAIATSGGYLLSMQINQFHSSYAMLAIQSFISGSLLHVVIHKPHDDGCMHTSHTHKHSHQSEQKPASRLSDKLPNKWELLGIILGILTLLMLEYVI